MERALIITGMHRSGTSLVSSLLQRFGVDIGENLLGPGEGNPRGHFEDLDFVRFHEDWMNRSGQRMLLQREFRPQISEVERERAGRLIAGRNGAGPWGFKDPRTSLFLPFWREILPGARFVLIFRHPIDVVLSLLRRGSDYEALVDPAAGLRSWVVHNRAILHFYRQAPKECFLAEIDELTEQIDVFPRELARKLGLELEPADASELFIRGELRSFSRTPGLGPLLRQLMPECIELFDQLREAADVACTSGVGAGDGPDLGALEALTLRIGGDLDSADLATAIVPALLATLDPGAVHQRRERLEKFVGHQQQAQRLLSLRDEEIVRLVDHAANLEALRLGGDEQMKALAGHAQNLEKLLADRDETLTELENHCQNLEELRRGDSAQLGQLEEHGRNLERRLEEREASLRELETHGSNLESRWNQAQADAEDLDSSLEQLNIELLDIEARSRALYQELSEKSSPSAPGEEMEDRVREDCARQAESPFFDRESKKAHAARQRVQQIVHWLAASAEEQARSVDLGTQIEALESARRQSEEAVEEFRAHGENLEKEIRRLEGELDSRREHSKNLESEVARLESALEDHRAHNANVESELGERSRQVLDLTGHIETLEAERERYLAEMVEQAEEGRAEIDRLGIQCRELETHASNLAEARGSVEKRRAALQAHVENLQQELDRREQLRLELEQHGTNLEKALGRERALLEDLRAHAENLQRELAASRENLDVVVENSREVEVSRERAERDLAQVSGELGKARDELAGWRAKARTQTEQSDRWSAEADRLGTEMEQREQELARHRSLLSDRELEIQELTASIQRAELQFRELESSRWVRMLRRVSLLPEPSPADGSTSD